MSIRSVGKAFETALLGTAGVALVVILIGLSPWKIPIPSLFQTDRKDRSQTPVLIDLRDVSRYEAATGSFQQIFDTEDDARYLPDIIKGERVTFIAEGSVDAVVDFSGLTAGAITVSADATTVTVALPAPILSPPRIDPDKTRVLSRHRGVLDRIQDAFGASPTDDQPLYRAATAKIAAAARHSQLLDRARTNTRVMLEALVKDLGYEKVVVRFETPRRP